MKDMKDMKNKFGGLLPIITEKNKIINLLIDKIVNNQAISNYDIIAWYNSFNNMNFKGITEGVIDRLDDNNFIFCFIKPIINQNQNLGHWILVFKRGNNYIIFDSENIPNLFNFVKINILNEEIKIERNDTDIQSDNSKLCGPYCMFIQKQLSKGLSFRKALDKLNVQDYNKNKNILIDSFIEDFNRISSKI